MKRTAAALLAPVVCLGLLAGCAGQEQTGGQESIPFKEGQLYAAVYLGYQEMDRLEEYAGRYLDSDQVPVHYLSDGDYYLVIPRYSGMHLSLYRNDLETSQPSLIYEDPNCGPFVLQCNVSDIFADATIRLTYEDETAEFSPFISLKDGSVDVGERGLDLTQDSP